MIRLSIFCFSILFCIFSQSTWGDRLIIEPEMGRDPIIKTIKEAKKSVSLAIYGFTDETLLNAILEAKLQGKLLKVLLEQKPYRAEAENKKTISFFKKNHINFHDSIPPYRFIHEKVLIVDNNKAIIMTFNFTHSTFNKERNFGLIINDPKRVAEINAIFSSDWSHGVQNRSHQDIIISPDNSREKLTALIDQAKQSIKIYAQNISDYQLVGVIAKAARRGVDVRILTSIKMKKKQNVYLKRAGVDVRHSRYYYIHAKTLVVDDQLAVIGSINLTSASLSKNRELAIITKDPTVIKQLNDNFEKDFSTSTPTIRQSIYGNTPYSLTRIGNYRMQSQHKIML